MILGRFLPSLVCATAGVLLAACASTSLVNQWRAPEYHGPKFTKVLVTGVSQQPSVRRVFEDEFSSRLRAAGVDATPSYTLMPYDGQADEAQLREAVQKSGAQGVLITRLVRVEQKTQVTPGVYRPMPVAGFYGWYASYWNGYYEPPTIYQYDIVTVETSLYSVPLSELVWSGMTETFSPQDVRKETEGFAKVIIEALRKQGLI